MAKLSFDVKKDANGFYRKPGMMGHRWAAETVDAFTALVTKVVKTKAQRKLVLALIEFDNMDWRYFAAITKKDVQALSYVLRRLGRVSAYSLLLWHNGRSGVLKSHLTHILEYMAYAGPNRDTYEADYVASRRFFGMSESDAKARFVSYHQKRLSTMNHVSPYVM